MGDMKSNANIMRTPTSGGARRHVPLDRQFVPIDKDTEIPLDLPPHWGRKLYGWLGWDELVERPRVVLLAEAGSGKTEEFEARAAALQLAGKFAVVVRVEVLADGGLDLGLDASKARQFNAWNGGSERGYYFLDSVDEARLTGRTSKQRCVCWRVTLAGRWVVPSSTSSTTRHSAVLCLRTRPCRRP